MTPVRFTSTALAAAALVAALAPALSPADEGAEHRSARIRHVLLLSIDGMHAVDYLNCSRDGSCPNLSALGAKGVSYTQASTSMPSDSFPGLMALVTGGSPKTVGAYYDVAYDRVLAPPEETTGNGVAGGACTEGVPNGTTTEYEEGVDIDQTRLNGGGPYGLTDGGIKAIDPKRLPRDPYNHCAPVYPWNFVRTNTIYGVIHAAHGYTAWSDKHPVYAAVSGPSVNASNVDDYYSPEINSTVVGLPGVTTATNVSCASVRDPSQTGSWTDSFQNIQCYDALKVNAIVNEIDGKSHDGTKAAPVPTLFGMNFQAVSVGQKLIENKTIVGGYTDAQGTPTPALKDEIAFVDASVGKMVNELKRRGLLDSTLIVVTAKHGQSPVDPARFFPIPGHSGGNGTSPADVIAAYLPDSESPLNASGIGPTRSRPSTPPASARRRTTSRSCG